MIAPQFGNRLLFISTYLFAFCKTLRHFLYKQVNEQNLLSLNIETRGHRS